jgi:predicted metal-dependent HD superfamily phosphohydrolase
VSPAGLEQRFVTLWGRCLPAAVSPDAAWAVLQRRYGEPHRHYHGFGHVAFCLRQLDDCRGRLQRPASVELALWFHDVVYEPGSASNEADSAELFRELCGGAEPALADTVSAWILDTTHATQPVDDDARYLVDIDLAGLGQSWEGFLRDNRALRREQPGTGDATYHRAEAAFLGRLLARTSLYCTDFFRARYEQRARLNIQRCLQTRGG